MNINEIYGSSEWLKAADLQGRKAKVKIKDWDQAEFKQQNGTVRKQVVLSFVGKDKRLGLNVTNAKMIASMYGDLFDGWLGQEIILYPSKTPNVSGQIVDCIRIEYQAPQPKAKSSASPELQRAIETERQQHQPVRNDMEDEIPF